MMSMQCQAYGAEYLYSNCCPEKLEDPLLGPASPMSANGVQQDCTILLRTQQGL